MKLIIHIHVCLCYYTLISHYLTQKVEEFIFLQQVQYKHQTWFAHFQLVLHRNLQCFSLTSSSVFPATSLGFTIFGEIFAYVAFFFFAFFLSNHRGSHIPSSWMMHAGFLLPIFTCLGHECQDLLGLCNGMHVCTDKTLFYTHPIEL